MDANDLNHRERQILVGVLRDLRKWSAMQPASFGTNRYAAADHNFRIREAKGGDARLNLAEWLGRAPDPTDATLSSRAYKRLESLGLVERFAKWGRYTTHLALKPEGERIAAELLAAEGTADAKDES